MFLVKKKKCKVIVCEVKKIFFEDEVLKLIDVDEFVVEGIYCVE